MMKRVLLLLTLLTVQYALSGDDIETVGSPLTPSPTVSIRRKSNSNPLPSVSNLSYLKSMKRCSCQVQDKKEKFEARIARFDEIFREVVEEKLWKNEKFAKKIEKFEKVVTNQSHDAPTDYDLLFDMDD